MASPAQLVSAISLATGVPLATVVDIDRKLVKGNLRKIGGRGLNAARMTSLDASRLLTAILGSAQSNLCVDAVQRYSQTRIDKTRSLERLFGDANLEELVALPARHSFVDALSALIASAATGSLAKQITSSKKRWMPSIEIFAFTRATRGRIRFIGLPNNLTVSVEYATMPHTKSTRGFNNSFNKLAEDALGDLEQSRRVTERTVLPIAKLLSDGDWDDRRG